MNDYFHVNPLRDFENEFSFRDAIVIPSGPDKVLVFSLRPKNTPFAAWKIYYSPIENGKAKQLYQLQTGLMPNVSEFITSVFRKKPTMDFTLGLIAAGLENRTFELFKFYEMQGVDIENLNAAKTVSTFDLITVSTTENSIWKVVAGIYEEQTDQNEDTVIKVLDQRTNKMHALISNIKKVTRVSMSYNTPHVVTISGILNGEKVTLGYNLETKTNLGKLVVAGTSVVDAWIYNHKYLICNYFDGNHTIKMLENYYYMVADAQFDLVELE